jgi:predicted DNA-binding antitoxin AbrB/MazE fold protein
MNAFPRCKEIEMAITVEATYKRGVLKPKKPLKLKEGSKVRLTITPVEDEPEDFLAGVIGICKGGPTDGAKNHDKYIYGDPHS